MDLRKVETRTMVEVTRKVLTGTSKGSICPQLITKSFPTRLKAKAAAPLVPYTVHKSMWNSICFAETPAPTCLGIFMHSYMECVSIQRDKGPSSPCRFAWSQTKLMWYLFGTECRSIQRAMPLNLSAKIFHSLIGNHYAHSLEVSLYFEWFVKQMERRQQ